jgi:hypothetical protein
VPRELVRDLEACVRGEPVEVAPSELARSVLRCAPEHTPPHGFHTGALARLDRHGRRSPVPRRRAPGHVTWRERLRRIAHALLGAAGLL